MDPLRFLMRHLWLTTTVFLMALGLLCTAVWSANEFGSVQQALAYCQGKRLFLVGISRQVAPDLEYSTYFTLKLCNKGASTIKIVGFGSSCGVRPLGDLPFAIKPGEVIDFRVNIIRPSRLHPVKVVEFRLYTDVESQPMTLIRTDLAPAVATEIRGRRTKSIRTSAQGGQVQRYMTF